MDGNCHVFAESHWKMLLKAIGQPLGNAKKVQERAGKCPKVI
jgi:hypothetical protein